MEHPFFVDLQIKYGLNDAQLVKVINMVYYTKCHDPASDKFQRVAKYICEAGLIEMPAEELVEELKLKGVLA